MTKGICHLSSIPQRSEASDKSEMVNQLIFGETYVIIERREKWVKIKTEWDEYEGWICAKQLFELTVKQEKAMEQSTDSYSIELVHSAISPDQHLPLLLGSRLLDFDGLNFKFSGKRFVFNGQAFTPDNLIADGQMVTKLALKYLHAPYLWGGKSPFGIDCSGLTQMVYRCLGVSLPRDAKQQVESGVNVDFVENAKSGDLAFFDSDGSITHVGIVYLNPESEREIIHASGSVRVDRLDNHGIYNRVEGKYSHALRVIKRVL